MSRPRQSAGKGQAAGGGPPGGRDGAPKRRRDELPRRVGEVLSPTLDRLATSDQARAYTAWARAVGDPVTGGTRPKAFSRGCLTIECASSVWATELTYLGPQILRRMYEVAPDHPVKRFRFVLGRLSGHAPEDPRPEGPPAEPASDARRRTDPAGEGSGSAAAKEESRDEAPAPVAYEAARAEAEGVRDERLRAAIEAALRRSPPEPPVAPGGATASG